jgi:trypsin
VSGGRRLAVRAYREHQALLRLAGRSSRRRPSLARAAVVGGTQVAIQQVPWQVVVLAEFEFEGELLALLCGGALTDPTHVVTAGHCTYNPGTGAPLPPGDFAVVAGASSITEAEIKHGTTVEARALAGGLAGVRRHPDSDYLAGPGFPDDIAELTLGTALNESAAIKRIALPSAQLFPPEGAAVSLSGYGAENPGATELNEQLHSLGMTLEPSSACGGEATADFLCARAAGGSSCNGDSGGAAVHQLVGLVDFGEGTVAMPCPADSLNGFVNVSAPEIRDFIEGNESPPLAPRGEVVLLGGEPVIDTSLTCEALGWGNSPTFKYAFINSANGAVLQEGASPTYGLSEADLGRQIYCRLTASTAGGVATARSSALAAVSRERPAPPPGGGGSFPGSGRSGAPALGLPGSSPGPSSPTGLEGVFSEGDGEIAALIGRELVPSTRGMSIASLLGNDGFTFSFKALEAGTVTIDWYEASARATSSKSPRRTLVAAGRATFSKRGTKRIKVKLTVVGRRLLQGVQRVGLTAKDTFTPNGEEPVTRTRTFTLRR